MSATLEMPPFTQQREDVASWTAASMVAPETFEIIDDPMDLPESFGLGSLRDGRLRIVEPIAVTWMRERNKYVVEATELNEFGFGANLSEALKDLQATLGELYHTLESDQDRLGPDLLLVWETLARKVRKANAVKAS